MSSEAQSVFKLSGNTVPACLFFGKTQAERWLLGRSQTGIGVADIMYSCFCYGSRGSISVQSTWDWRFIVCNVNGFSIIHTVDDIKKHCL